MGEVRGGEAFDLWQALSTGHAGILATIHANSAEQALTRFTSCVLISGIELPYPAMRAGIAESLQLIVHIERIKGRRIVSEALAVQRYSAINDHFELQSIFTRQ